MKRNPLIMIVDDIFDNIEILLTVLKVRGYDLVYAMSGREALEKLETCHPDLILLDVLMPEMDGFETCDAIKDMDSMIDVPIIFLTGVQNQEYILKGFEYGAVDYITKPFNTLELISRVKNHVDLKQSKDKLIEYQAQLQKHIADKNKFFSIIAEDLRTNFSSFMGLVNILAGEHRVMSEDDRDLILKNVSDSGNGLNAVLYNLVIWAQLQIDTLSIQLRAFNLTDLLKDVAFKSAEARYKKNITMEQIIPDNLLAILDYNAMIIAFDSILDNAIKYSPDGSNIKIEAKNKDEKWVEVSIEDNGEGIPEEALAQIFCMDKKKCETIVNSKAGLGLGLILTKELIEKNNGNIYIKSTLGIGTEVIIVLPR